MAHGPYRDAATRAKKRSGGGGGRDVSLAAAVYTGTGTMPTSVTVLSWDTPHLNEATWSYGTGVFTVPSALNGWRLEFNVQIGGVNTTTDRCNLEMQLQRSLNSGGGWVTQIVGHNYATRNNGANSDGATWISGYIAEAAAATGDQWRVTIRETGTGAMNYDGDACHISIKAYSA